MQLTLPQRFHVLRGRNFRLYWIGQLISLTGMWMQAFASSWVVLDLLDRSAFSLAIVNFAVAIDTYRRLVEVNPEGSSRGYVQWALVLSSLQPGAPRALVEADRLFARALEVEVADLAERMHAGIGAPGAVHGNALAGEFLDRVLQRRLHRRAVRLALEPDERRPVVFDRDAPAGHDPHPNPPPCRGRESMAGPVRSSP